MKGCVILKILSVLSNILKEIFSLIKTRTFFNAIMLIVFFFLLYKLTTDFLNIQREITEIHINNIGNIFN